MIQVVCGYFIIIMIIIVTVYIHSYLSVKHLQIIYTLCYTVGLQVCGVCYVSKNNQVLEQSAMKEICTAIVELEVMIIFTLYYTM